MCSDLHILGNVQRKWRKTEEEDAQPLGLSSAFLYPLFSDEPWHFYQESSLLVSKPPPKDLVTL